MKRTKLATPLSKLRRKQLDRVTLRPRKAGKTTEAKAFAVAMLQDRTEPRRALSALVDRWPHRGAEVGYVFAPNRGWSFPVAWVWDRIALEIEDGEPQDVEKANEALLSGWLVVRATPAMLDNGAALALVERAMLRRKQDEERRNLERREAHGEGMRRATIADMQAMRDVRSLDDSVRLADSRADGGTNAPGLPFKGSRG